MLTDRHAPHCPMVNPLLRRNEHGTPAWADPTTRPQDCESPRGVPRRKGDHRVGTPRDDPKTLPCVPNLLMSSQAMDDQTKQVFTSASDWSKQILTLSTGIVTLTITFADKIFGDLSSGEKWLLYVSWALYLVSIFFGVWFLSALTGTLATGTSLTPASVNGANMRIPGLLQLFAFVAGTAAIVIFGFLSAGNEDKTPGTTPAYPAAISRS